MNLVKYILGLAILVVVLVFIYNGLWSTFAKLQRRVAKNDKAADAMFEFFRQTNEWEPSGSRIKGSWKILVPLSTHGPKLIPYWFRYVGEGDSNKALKQILQYVIEHEH